MLISWPFDAQEHGRLIQSPTPTATYEPSLTTIQPMPPTFHSYKDIFAIPANVSSLVEEMGKPLPDVLQLALCENTSLSPVSRQLLQRILPEAYHSRDDVANLKLLDVLDVTLMTSAAIEERMRGSDAGDRGPISRRQRTSPQWHTLLRTLGRVCCSDSRVLANISFVHPRDSEREQGLASMLIGLAVTSSMFPPTPGSSNEECSSSAEQSTEHHDGSSPSDSAEDESSLSRTGKYYDSNNPVFVNTPTYHVVEDAEVMFGLYDTHGEESVEEESTMDLPQEAHMLAGKDERTLVFFPVVCIAEKDDIVPLVASAACQRHAWGLDIPTVGFQIGSYVQVYIAWSDASAETKELPNIHILGPASGHEEHSKAFPTAHSALGSFNLAQPHSVLQFASFVLSLRAHFELLQQALPPTFPGRLLWRADECYANATNTRILNWRRTVDTAIHDIESDLSELRYDPSINITAQPVTTALRHEIDMKSQSDVIRSPSEGGSPYVARSSRQADTQGRSNHLSCLEFAEQNGRTPLQDLEETSIASWLIERSVLTLTRVEQLEDTPLLVKPDGYDAMIEIYDQMTSLQFIQEWDCDGVGWRDAVPIDRCFAHYRDMFFDSYIDALKAIRSCDKQTSVVTYMDPLHANIIKSRLSLLFKAVSDSLIAKTSPDEPIGNECQYEWDSLLENFYVSQVTELSSNKVTFEQRLRLPKNTFYEAFHSGTGAEARTRLLSDLQEHQQHLNSVSKYCDTHRKELGIAGTQGYPFRRQCTSAQADLMTQRIIYNNPRLHELAEAVDRNFSDEPCTGVCDAVLFTARPLAMDGCKTSAEEVYEQSLFINDNPSNLSSRGSQGTARLVLLPQLLVEHSKPNKKEYVALNQDRMYCVAAVSYLASIGITEYPVFGLVTYGPLGAIIMAWKSKEGKTYLMERNARKFDLRKPLEAFQFASFLVRLRGRDKTMEDALELHEEELIRRQNLKENDLTDWAMPL